MPHNSNRSLLPDLAQPFIPPASVRFLRAFKSAGRRRSIAALVLSAAASIAGCSALTPVEKLLIAQDAEPLLAQIRAGEVGVDDRLAWGGALGAAPSYFTPLCAAAFGGAVSAVEELLALGAAVDVECGPSVTPLDLVLRHPSPGKAMAMRRLLQERAATARTRADFPVQARS